MHILVSSLSVRYIAKKDGAIPAQEIEQYVQMKLANLPRQLDYVSLTFLRVLLKRAFPESEVKDTFLSVSDDKPSYPLLL